MVDRLEDDLSGLRNLSICTAGPGADVLIFDPFLARRLNWRQAPNDPLSFCGAGHDLMATTVFWRDGWQQPLNHATTGRWAEGQRVELTQAPAWKQSGSWAARPNRSFRDGAVSAA